MEMEYDKPNLEVVEIKDAIRAEIEKQINDFFAKGGQIRKMIVHGSVKEMSEQEKKEILKKCKGRKGDKLC
jgi:hypothetical protein